MNEQKKERPDRSSGQGASEKTLHINDNTDTEEMQDLDALLIAEVWDCALKILNGCGGNFVAAKREVSRILHCAPREPQLKRWIRKMLRTAMYYQVTRNLRVPLRQLKVGTAHD